MISYVELKQKIVNNKPKIILIACFVLIFIIGFGTGKADKSLGEKGQKAKQQSNYSKTPEKKPEEKPADLSPEVLTKGEALAKAGECAVKGNISAKGDKVYHVKSGAFYKKVKPEQCFASESNAKAAGFRKSNR